MATKRETVRYEVDGVACESIALWDDATTGARPGILIAPTFMGPSPFEEERAERLAALGYAALVIDIFGTSVRPKDGDEAMAAMTVLNEDRVLIARRITAALEQLRALDVVDPARTAAIGFCFGGKCVLDLARTGADVAGVATFHGIFDAPPIATAEWIGAKILAMHGWDDPLALPDAVVAFAKEMTEKGAIWELDAYGHTEHGFTNRNRPQMYRELADQRSWARLAAFLGELFPA